MAVPPGGFPATLRRHVGPGSRAMPAMPVVIAGMVGSRNGWVEAPYVACPTIRSGIAARWRRWISATGSHGMIVPGLTTRDSAGVPDVMRGEETKLAGCGVADGLVVSPGTHAKWVRMAGGPIEGFATYMTGDFYGAFIDHTILGKLAEEPDGRSRVRPRPGGVGAAGRPDASAFSARTLVLMGDMTGAQVGPFLSGLLIGSEVRHALHYRRCRTEEAPATSSDIGGSRGAGLRAGARLRRPHVPHRWLPRPTFVTRTAARSCETAEAEARARAGGRDPADLPKERPMTHRHDSTPPSRNAPSSRSCAASALRGGSVGEALVAAGIRVLEVPLNSPQPLDSIRHLREALAGRAVVGAGTVYRESDVDDVAEAGGVLIVSPNANPAVIAHAKRLGLVSAPGVMTPTEAISALDAGADVLKLFPGEVISPAAVRAYAAVMPAGTRLVLVGGVTTANLRDYADTPLAGYGIGSALYKPGLSAGRSRRAGPGLSRGLCRKRSGNAHDRRLRIGERRLRDPGLAHSAARRNDAGAGLCRDPRRQGRQPGARRAAGRRGGHARGRRGARPLRRHRPFAAARPTAWTARGSRGSARPRGRPSSPSRRPARTPSWSPRAPIGWCSPASSTAWRCLGSDTLLLQREVPEDEAILAAKRARAGRGAGGAQRRARRRQSGRRCGSSSTCSSSTSTRCEVVGEALGLTGRPDEMARAIDASRGVATIVTLGREGAIGWTGGVRRSRQPCGSRPWTRRRRATVLRRRSRRRSTRASASRRRLLARRWRAASPARSQARSPAFPGKAPSTRRPKASWPDGRRLRLFSSDWVSS